MDKEKPEWLQEEEDFYRVDDIDKLLQTEPNEKIALSLSPIQECRTSTILAMELIEREWERENDPQKREEIVLQYLNSIGFQMDRLNIILQHLGIYVKSYRAKHPRDLFDLGVED